MYINYKHYFVMAKGILQFLCKEEADESVIPVRTKIQQGKRKYRGSRTNKDTCISTKSKTSYER